MDGIERATHFEFGKNWESYASLIDDSRLAAAMENVRSLAGDIRGMSFLDIGSGSGLFSKAALRMGAHRVVAVDLDENAVRTTRAVLAGEDGEWEVLEASLFDLPAKGLGTFDIVYAWGVLHHSGGMWRAIDRAAEMVASGGVFAFALYERTLFCRAWRVEKLFYRKAPGLIQAAMRGAYFAALSAGFLARGKNPLRNIRTRAARGMDVRHDVHDWLGGYPYESTGFDAVDARLRKLGFVLEQHRPAAVPAGGIFGSACSEYVYRK
jgi:2-polyprenyl-6-hydroxyphenyl methylase/3-demethylubiquinone-9 3-methyltransferase